MFATGGVMRIIRTRCLTKKTRSTFIERVFCLVVLRGGRLACARAPAMANAASMLAMRAVFLRARTVKCERMLLEPETALLGNGLLTVLDFGVEEFLDEPAIDTDEVVVVRPFVQLKNRFTRFEVAARKETSLFELREYAIDRREADVEFFVQQIAIDVFSREVTHGAVLEDLENLEAR
jgi:hypothetical protein